MIPKSICFFILNTGLLDTVLITRGEILSWSLMGVKGLRVHIDLPGFWRSVT